MKILLTGGAGYIGSVLTNELLLNGHEVYVADILWFNKSTPLIHYNNPNYNFYKTDVRDKNAISKLLEKVDFIIHPAAIVGDPASKKFPELTKEINEIAAKNVIDVAAESKVKGFIFFSTCSNYGISNDGLANEDTQLNPLSLYAETKVNIEKYLQENSKNLNWVIGRLSTVYGISPRMRFDLTVNEFALKGFKDKYIDIFRPESYRPYVHVYDLSKIITEIINNFQTVKNNVFNIGFPGENYRKIEIANAVNKYIPETKIDILKEGGDNRDYQVDFTKLSKFLDVEKNYDVEKSVKETIEALEMGLFGNTNKKEFSNTTPDIEE